MSTPVPTEEFDAADEESEGPSRRRATLAILPFLGLGLFSVVVLLGWGIDPLWAFAILPPILFISVLGWIAFKTGFVDGPD